MKNFNLPKWSTVKYFSYNFTQLRDILLKSKINFSMFCKILNYGEVFAQKEIENSDERSYNLYFYLQKLKVSRKP